MDKVTKKIYSLGLLVFLFTTQSFNIFGQEKIDLSGVFEGEHIEFSTDGSNDSMIYLYKFELTQNKKNVTGKSYIYNSDGYYAVVQLRGLIVDHELYFEEFETIDEINPELNHWCYTSGHLTIYEEKDKISLSGYTKSYTKEYGSFCRLGYSKVHQQREANDNIENDEPSETSSNIRLQANPTEAETNLSFTLTEESLVILEVRDLQGELIMELVNRKLTPGEHTYLIDLSFHKEGMYIVELIVNRKLYSRELWKGTF